MIITVNLNDKSTEYIQSSVNIGGLTVDELINNLIAEHLQEKTKNADPYEKNGKESCRQLTVLQKTVLKILKMKD